MNKSKTVQAFMQRALLQHASLGFVLLVVIAFATAFLLTREQMATDLQESASATAQAFKDRILDGDIRSVESQIHEVLKLKDGEVVKILKADHSPIYRPISGTKKIQPCPVIGNTCFDGYLGQARVEFPISMSSSNQEPFRYLYLSRAVHLNWSFLITVFIVFSIGYISLVLAFLRISKIASLRLGKEIENWSARVNDNPKDTAPLKSPPFAELMPLKNALEGLNAQIEKFERKATDKAKLLILRGIAHDILTPVSQLQLNLATLEHRIKSAEHDEILGDIRYSLKKVCGIASQVKSLRETNSNENTELVAAAFGEIKALRDSEEILERSIKLEFNSEIKNISCPFSQTDISRIIANLVQNAADASGSGGLVSVNVGSQNGMAFLSVQDHGCGIPTKAKEHVFDPDFTLKPGTGTGLGLAVVKYICDKRSAKIDLESELNKGTTVTIRVPTLGAVNV